jgi:DNA-binding response OmpR family regulator
VSTVLVVDDDPAIREVLRIILIKDGHTVLAAGRAGEARDILARDSVDLLLLDIDMPGETGVELMLELREEPRFRKLPVIFVTAYPDRSRPIQATKLGAAAVITKPFRMTDVRITVNQVANPHGETDWKPG